MNWLNKLEWKMRKFCIPNLMNYIVGGMAVIFLVDLLMPYSSLWSRFYLDWAQVMRGEVWRLLTFAILPPSSSVIWIIFSLYFYWMIGNGLESKWGSFRFNLFYLVGILGNILSAAITGYAVNTYLNLSLFFAFASIYPNFELMLFFILPVKMKYLAIFNAVLYLYSFVVGNWSIRLCIILSLINVILFLGKDLWINIKQDSQYWKTRYNFRKAMRNR